MTSVKSIFVYIQYLIYCSAIPSVILGSLFAYVCNTYNIPRYWFILPIIVLALAWNYLLLKAEVLEHLFYLNGVENKHIKFSEAQDNITTE